MKMTRQQQQRLMAQSRVGQQVRFRDKRGSGSTVMGVVEDEVYVMVGDYKHMLQRIQFNPDVSWDGSRFAYRTGYYTYDASMRRIVWGQYTPFLTEKEYRSLLRKARKKGWQLL